MIPPLLSSKELSTQIGDNISVIQRRISEAARRAARDPNDVALMAVTKTQPAEKIIAAYEAGIRYFGENRVQEFAAKHQQLAALQGATFTLIGQLQSNKVNKAIELFSALHSVDSLRLAERINTAIERSRREPLPIAIEINTGDAAKAGLAPDAPELEQLLNSAPRLLHLRIQGLMTIPPFTPDPEGERPYFRRLRELRDSIVVRRLPGIGMDLLSMGMSHDFEVAIEEGSTCVRVGTAIFGERQK
jgi:pyridoxal phosphate enzyme (YggS family)